MFIEIKYKPAPLANTAILITRFQKSEIGTPETTKYNHSKILLQHNITGTQIEARERT